MSFDVFYAERWADAVRLAFVICGDTALAEDVAQESMARVQARYETLDAPWPYTRTTIVNLCRSNFRRRRREEARLALVAVTEPGTSDLETSELLDVIDRLPYRQKVVIVLRYYEGLSELEIAEALGCRPGTVKSLASRALSRLALEVQR